MKRLPAILLLSVIFLFVISMRLYAQQPAKAPKVPALPNMAVTDTLHGVMIQDPYRGLEQTENPQVMEWLKAQRQYADSVLKSHPIYDSLLEEIARYQAMTENKISFPMAVDTTLFFVSRKAASDKEQLIMRKGYEGRDKVLYQTADQTIEFFSPSPTKAHVVIALTSQGKEVSTLYVYDIPQGKLLKDSIPRNLLSLPEWLPDGSGFFYQQLSNTDKLQERFLNSQVKLHLLGMPQEKDQTVLSSRLQNFIKASDFPYIHLYPNSEYALAAIYEGTDFNASLYIAPLQDILAQKSVRWQRITTPDDEVTNFALRAGSLYLLTTKYHEQGEVIAIPALSTDLSERETILQADSAIVDEFLLTRDGLYVKTSQAGISDIYRYDLANREVSKLEVPVKGKIIVNSFSRPVSYMHCQGLFLGAESWTKPYGLYHYDPEKQTTTAIDVHLHHDYPVDLMVEQTEATGHDGVKIPLTIIYKKGLKRDKRNPVLLYAYGSHGLSVEPAFYPLFVPWYERGGVFAVAHVRGGGEKGRLWHEAGRLDKKPNSWKDFIACAEYLFNKQYTSPDHLAAYGASAGGITIGRAVTEAPDLFQAAVVKVGVVNPLRFEETGNIANVTEFGTNKDAVQFQYLLEMDAYHHIKADMHYPAMLFTAGINDNRVAVWQPAKMVARLQDVDPSSPTLFYVQDEGGHFGGKNQEVVSEYTNIFTFLLWQLCNVHAE